MMNAAVDVCGAELASERESTDFVERVRLPLAAMKRFDPQMFELLQFWQALRHDGLLPSRDLINPLHLKPFLGRLHVVETTAATPENYYFRLWGGSVTLDRGRDYRKLSIGEYPRAAWRRAVIQDYADSVKMGVPAYHLVAAQLHFVPYEYARLILPFAEDGRQVSQLLVYINERRLAEPMHH